MTFPKGYDEFSQADLTGFVVQWITPEDQWWLRPAALGEVETDGDAGTLHDLFNLDAMLNYSQIWLTRMLKKLQRMHPSHLACVQSPLTNRATTSTWMMRR